MAESLSAAPARAPWHLWVVGGLSLVWNAMGALDYTMTETRNAAYLKSMTPEQLAYLESFPAWAVAIWAIAVWGALLGSLLLLSRKCHATPVFVVSFVAMLGTMIWSYGVSDGARVMGGAGAVVVSGAVFVVALALWFYARTMDRRGVLR